MWKIAVGFAVFAALALFILSKGGDIDMGGEKHGAEATHAPAAAVAVGCGSGRTGSGASQRQQVAQAWSATLRVIPGHATELRKIE
ncbi:MAG: hypothetical protein IPO43_23100 [Rhodoferax sp.]|nr:hypothetical protein [Rhodoferax sp.]